MALRWKSAMSLRRRTRMIRSNGLGRVEFFVFIRDKFHNCCQKSQMVSSLRDSWSAVTGLATFAVRSSSSSHAILEIKLLLEGNLVVLDSVTQAHGSNARLTDERGFRGTFWPLRLRQYQIEQLW